MQTEEAPARVSLSPTFNSYSSGNSGLAEIAARVVRELGEEPFSDADNYEWKSQGSIFHFQENFSNGRSRESDQEEARRDNVDDDGGDDEFEFVILCREPDTSTISANEIFYNGQIRPVYPVFNMDLLPNDGSQKHMGSENFKPTPAVHRLPLRKLMNEERETMSSSSSEADDLEGVPSDMYCVWSPKTEEASPRMCKKSQSTGWSNRWKLRNLLYNYNRSKSDGEDALGLWTPSNKGDRAGDVSKGKEGIRVATATSPGSGRPCVPAHKAYYGRNRAMREADKRRSYLPYRQGLVGCVADVNATTKYLHPF